jgi:AAA+ ATPase superfamily predicted ATPase
MIEKFLQAIPRKSYNNFANVVLLLFFFSGLVLVPIAEDLDRRTDFRCSPSKEVTSRLDFVQLVCHSKYVEAYHLRISFGSLVLLNFVIILAFSIFYASWARVRVEKWDISTKKTEGKRRWENGNAGISLFYIYIVHLLLSRFLLLLLFAAVVFYPINVPTHFSCSWRHPPSDIPCVDVLAAKKMRLASVVATIDLVFAFFALAEVFYILHWKRRNQEFSAITDPEFISVYILARRENIGTIINQVRKSARVDTKFFITPIIRENRNGETAGKTPQNGQHNPDGPRDQIRQVEDIFEPIINLHSNTPVTPRRILIIGRPGIGKTALTKCFLQEWKKKTVDFWKGKLVIRVALRVFNHEKDKKLNLPTLFSYGDGVTPGAGKERLQDLYQFMVLHEKDVVVIFDGLDELDVDLDRCWQDEEEARSLGADDEMSVFSLYVKLVRRDFLPNVTIVTTARQTAEQLYQDLYFDKKLEILGYTEAEIVSFVKAFCRNKQRLSKEIWSVIKQSPELLDICYCPVSCYMVCLTLEQSIVFDKQETFALTMTEIYRRYIIIVLHEHQKLPRGKRKRKVGDIIEGKLPSELQNELIQLAKLAKMALGDKWCLQFQLSDEFSSLANCGLLEKVDKKRHLYSFPHPTIQEYLAAVYLFDDLENISKCLGSKMKLARWHVVLQFLACLMGNEIRQLRNQTLAALSSKKEDELIQIIYDA